MIGTQSSIVAALMMLGLFAGCIAAESTVSQGSGGVAGGQPQVAAGPAEFDETTGAITGQVTTADLLGIANAQVGILASDLIPSPLLVLTNEVGQFTISHVPPGTHSMQVSALGFEAAAKRADVTAGVVTTVNFVLVELPSEEPYMNTIYEAVQLTSLMYKLTPTCIYGTDYVPVTGVSTVDSYRTQAKTCGGVRSNQLAPGGQQIVRGCSACESHTATNEKYQSFNEYWQTIVGEVTWQAQSGATGRGFLFDISAPNVTRGTGGSINQASTYTWYKGTDKAPIHIRIDKPTTLIERNILEADWNNYPDGEGCTAPGDANCDWFWRMFGARCDLGICDEGTGPDYGLLIEAKAEVYFSYFIRQGAPEGFSALPDG